MHDTFNYYCLNNSLSVNNEFKTAVSPFVGNEICATIYGPAFKNKLFYFGAIDVLRSSVTTSTRAPSRHRPFDAWAKANLPNSLGTQSLLSAPPQQFPTTGILTVTQLQAKTPGYYPLPANLPDDLAAVGTSNISFSTPEMANWGAGNFVQTTYGWRCDVDDTDGSRAQVWLRYVQHQRSGSQTSAFTRLISNSDNLRDFVQSEATSESGSPVSLTTHQQGCLPAPLSRL